MSEPQTLYQSDHFRAVLFGADSDFLIVTFDHWQRNKNSFGEPRHAGYWAKNGVSQLSLKSRRNDWFVNNDTARLEEVLRSVSERFTRIHSLGFSMGGYAALRLSRALCAQRVLLVSPQFSVWPEHVGQSQWCKRYDGNRDADYGSLSRHGLLSQKGDLVYDPFNQDDAHHAQLCLALFPNINAVRMPFAGHPAHLMMSESGKFRAFQQAAMSNASAQSILLAEYKSVRRKSEKYRRNLANHLEDRGRSPMRTNRSN